MQLQWESGGERHKRGLHGAGGVCKACGRLVNLNYGWWRLTVAVAYVLISSSCAHQLDAQRMHRCAGAGQYADSCPCDGCYQFRGVLHAITVWCMMVIIAC